MNICVIGVGYVGLVTGACFAEFGIKVTCVDNDLAKIAGLKQGKIPIYEPGLEELVAKNVRENRLQFTEDLEEAVKHSLVIFIAVGTPPDRQGRADLQYVRAVAEAIGRTMDGYKIIVTKSTVPVGTGKVIADIVRQHQKKKHAFDIVSNPEFLREGSAIEDFLRPNRVVIGAESDQAVAIMKDLYSPLYLIETPFVITGVETAEMIKYASNAFLATKISFINEMANICERVGADVQQVAKGMGLDQRIGPKFLHAGPGFGGSCFPKDTQAIVQLAKALDYDFEIVQAVLRVNQRQRQRMVDKIVRAVGSPRGKRLGVLGLTFKPNTDDIRDAPAFFIIKKLQALGARVQAYDPAGMPEAQKILKQVDFKNDAYEVGEGAEALILITEWNQFRNIDWPRMKKLLQRPVVVDLRNVYDPVRMQRQGFQYYGVGRPALE
ncbi:MAG: UDP-glucose/GDP-mannose dehydrogenase family protein [Desulfobacterota bacterium]|jgi:UDPglucose 6-dehydrogenase|nr:UDP-glucose/GDP-mannose dehydrogenase family protein [Thermodesulfobacteriota bacterium]